MTGHVGSDTHPKRTAPEKPEQSGGDDNKAGGEGPKAEKTGVTQKDAAPGENKK